MSQVVARTNFNSSRLVRCLEQWASSDVPESQQALAQRLGQWVSFTDAAALYTALDGSTVRSTFRPPSAKTQPKSAAHCAANEELTRVRSAMADVIHKACAATPSMARIKFPAPQPGTSLEIAVMYSPFHRFYQALQRDMEVKVGPLRARVREALMVASPALQQLAVLDATFEKILSDRERRLLSTVPVLLQRRFEQLLQAHLQALASAGQADDLMQWMRPGAWLTLFREDLHGVLLAEWEVRLLPVLGLVEALRNEVNG